MGRRTENRLDALTDAIKEKRRVGAEKVTVIKIICDDYIEIYNLETGEITRVSNQDEQQDK